MKHKPLLSFLLAAVTLLSASDVFADKFQRATVYRTLGCAIGVDCIASGDATLVRNPRGVELNLTSSSLEPNAIYTFWWVIFNKPNKCATSPCAGSDLGNPAVKGVVRWGGAFTTDSGGIGSGTAHLGVGDISGDTSPGFTGSTVGLKNGITAEIHVVTRTHGSQLGSGYDQLFSYEGGCGVNMCMDDQFAVFVPPPKDDD